MTDDQRIEKIKNRIYEFKKINWAGNQLGDFVSSSDVLFLLEQLDKEKNKNKEI